MLGLDWLAGETSDFWPALRFGVLLAVVSAGVGVGLHEVLT